MIPPTKMRWRAALAAGLWALRAAAADPAARVSPTRPEIVSAHGSIRRTAAGGDCVFEEAPPAEVIADLAQAWEIPVAYFGPPNRRFSAHFTAPTAAAALLQFADRTDLRLAACGRGWCLEEGPALPQPPALAAPWRQRKSAAAP